MSICECGHETDFHYTTPLLGKTRCALLCECQALVIRDVNTYWGYPTETDTIIYEDTSFGRHMVCKRCGEEVVHLSRILMDTLKPEDIKTGLTQQAEHHYTKCTGVRFDN